MDTGGFVDLRVHVCVLCRWIPAVLGTLESAANDEFEPYTSSFVDEFK